MPLNKKLYDEVSTIFTAYLENKELRRTPERYAILEQIYSTDGHFDVESLYVSMKNKGYRVSRATVYNTLDLLNQCNLVTRHQFGQTQSRQHDHLICVDCNKVVEFCDPRIQNIQNTVQELMQFEVVHHSLILYAGCKKVNCENKKS
jgi:Fur family transcriptional regulator, ferric uptake regulator